MAIWQKLSSSLWPSGWLRCISAQLMLKFQMDALKFYWHPGKSLQLLTSCKSLWSMLPASMPKASDKTPAVALRSGVSSWAETAMKRVSNCSITRIFSGMRPPNSSPFSAHLQSRSRHPASDSRRGLLAAGLIQKHAPELTALDPNWETDVLAAAGKSHGMPSEPGTAESWVGLT